MKMFDIAFPQCYCVDSVCSCDVSDDPSGNFTTGYVTMDSDEAQKKLLFQAVQYDQQEVLEHMLKVGANPNVFTSDDTPLLNLAIEKGNYDVIETILHYGYNVNNCDKNNQTALMCGVCMDDLAIVKLLVKAGANLDALDNTGKSALLIALRDNRYDIANYLIKKGSDVNIVDRLGQSSLFFLANSENKQTGSIIRKILSSGYNITKDRTWIGDSIDFLDKAQKESVPQKILRQISRKILRIKKAHSPSQTLTISQLEGQS